MRNSNTSTTERIFEESGKGDARQLVNFRIRQLAKISLENHAGMRYIMHWRRCLTPVQDIAM